MRYLRSLRPSDSGATVVLVALAMMLLMGIAAVALDGGRGFNERRQAQSGVDFASLAALEAATGANPADSGANEAIAVVAANLPGRSLDWASCTDPARPPEYDANVSSVTECISFTENFGQARVQLPLDELGTTFAAVIGVDNINVKTDAEAIQSTQATADIVPWTAGAGSHVCLFSNQAPQTVPPCDGPESGFFGYLDVALYGSSADELDNPSTCELGTSNVRSGINVAKGADHIMVEWNSGDPIVHDHAACPNKSEDINQLEVQTGSPTQGATEGLITGVSGSINGDGFGSAPGRLVYNSAWSASSVSVRGFSLDDTPLWNYLNDSACPWAAAAVSGSVDDAQEMELCLDAWDETDGPIFSLDIQGHPRFAAVPRFTTYPTGPGSYLIDFFSPVWFQTIYQNCNANRCHTIFSPGEAGGSATCPADLATNPTINCGHGHTSGPDTIEGVTAFQLKLGMLHPDTQAFFPGTRAVRTLFLLQ
jgi:hypothetical protein